MDTNLTQEEIEKILNWAYEHIDQGTTRYSGMTYEQGIRDMIGLFHGEVTVEEFLAQ